MTGADVAVSRDGAVGVVTLRRPPTNYFDEALLAELADRCDELAAETDTHVVVLAAEGRHFCAGADFGAQELTTDRVAVAAAIYTQAARLFEVGVPLVAAVQGAAVGGGLGLACAADFRVGTTRTRFHANFGALGFHHGFGLSVTLPRIVGSQRAQDLLLTSRVVHGEEALRIGLIDRLAGEDGVLADAIGLAHEIAACGPKAVVAMRATLAGDRSAEVRRCLEHELTEQTRLWATPESRRRIEAALAGARTPR